LRQLSTAFRIVASALYAGIIMVIMIF